MTAKLKRSILFDWFFVLQLLGTDRGWPYLLGFGFFVALLQIFTLPFCPRSPRYLLLKLNNEPKTVEGMSSVHL